MASRKKTTKAKKNVENEAPVITHVVEIVDESTGETKPVAEGTIRKEEVKEVVEDLKDEVKDVEDKVEELETKVEPELEKAPEPTQEEKDKDVIGELFGSQTASMAAEISGESKGSRKSIILWAILIIGVALLTGAGLLVIVRGPDSLTAMFAKPTPTPTSTPSPTPTLVAPDRSAVTIEVLNGSGVAGAAAKAKDFLMGKGYKVGKTGNAATSDFTLTEIHVKKEKEGTLPLLKDDLKDGYTIGTSAADLSADSSSDARVIIGQK